jgi:hypothetical protein
MDPGLRVNWKSGIHCAAYCHVMPSEYLAILVVTRSDVLVSELDACVFRWTLSFFEK